MNWESVRAQGRAALCELQVSWPGEVYFVDPKRQSPLYETYPYLLLPAFNDIAPNRVAQFNLYVRLFAISIFEHDKLADEDQFDGPIPRSLRTMACQFEAYHLLQALFPPDARFWVRLRRYLSEYADACLQEERIRSGAIPWTWFTESRAVKMAKAKSGVAKSVAAGLADLANDERPLEALTNSIDHYNIAVQHVDDLRDWKADARFGRPTLLLRRLGSVRPKGKRVDSLMLERLGRSIYYEGHAQSVLDSALVHLERASDVVTPLPVDDWREHIASTEQAVASLADDLARTVRATQARASEGRLKAAHTVPVNGTI